MSRPGDMPELDEWTLEQAAEFLLEQVLDLLDGCDDDAVRPELVLDAIHKVWAPQVEVDWPTLTAGELRGYVASTRERLARGELIPLIESCGAVGDLAVTGSAPVPYATGG